MWETNLDILLNGSLLMELKKPYVSITVTQETSTISK
jgi:hypothetical protein